MLKIALINMPFADVQVPSIALTQIRSVLANSPGRIKSEIFYLNHNFARFLEPGLYSSISSSVAATTAGLGDWLFKDVAFPDAVEDSELYRLRYLRQFSRMQSISEDHLCERRREIEPFLDQLIDDCGLDRFSVIGLTSMFQQNVACFAMARKLKERNPDIVTVMGGANCESPMGQVIAENVACVDFVFSGPALKSFPQLIRFIDRGEEARCHQIQGVFSREKLALQKENINEIGEELRIDDAVSLEYGDFLRSFDEELPPRAGVPYLMFETSRGCWWGQRVHCTFCGLNGATMSYQSMEPRKALKQFEDLFAYAPRVSHFDAVDNIMPREYLSEVFPYLEAPEGVSIFYEVRADLKDEEMAILAKAGVRRVQPGIEALATSALKLMRKGTTAFLNIKFLKSCLRHGIDAFWNLLIGFPGDGGESYEKYVRDLPSLIHLPPPAGVYPVRFDRFSPYFRSAEEYGLDLKPYDFYGLIYPFDEEDLRNFAYYFIDENFSAPYIEAMASWITRLSKEVDAWRARWGERHQRSRPQLTFKWRNGSKVVYDSRSGTAVEREIGGSGLRILELLSQPMKLPRLTKRLRNLSESECHSQIATLQKYRLIFQEGDLYLSLVMEACETETAWLDGGFHGDVPALQETG